MAGANRRNGPGREALLRGTTGSSNVTNLDEHPPTSDGRRLPGAARRSPAGLTFVEVMIATTILAVGALVAFPTMLSFADLSDTAREENVATHDLMTAVEDVMSTPFTQITTTYKQGEVIPRFTALHLSEESIVVAYDDPAADPLIITMTASWKDRKGHPMQETFRCVRTR
jgi:prepilin-type N-terminal cleavage/methylation domain-containing protein